MALGKSDRHLETFFWTTFDRFASPFEQEKQEDLKWAIEFAAQAPDQTAIMEFLEKVNFTLITFLIYFLFSNLNHSCFS